MPRSLPKLTNKLFPSLPVSLPHHIFYCISSQPPLSIFVQHVFLRAPIGRCSSRQESCGCDAENNSHIINYKNAIQYPCSKTSGVNAILRPSLLLWCKSSSTRIVSRASSGCGFYRCVRSCTPHTGTDARTLTWSSDGSWAAIAAPTFSYQAKLREQKCLRTRAGSEIASPRTICRFQSAPFLAVVCHQPQAT